MLTLSQIKKAINDRILAKFPTIEIQASDVEEGFTRPSFFVRFDNLIWNTRQYFTERGMTVRIYYFPSDRYVYSLESMDVQDSLGSIFNLNFNVADRVLTINEVRGQTIDGVLEFEFDFEFVESTTEVASGDLMQEVNYNG